MIISWILMNKGLTMETNCSDWGLIAECIPSNETWEAQIRDGTFILG